MNYKVHILKGDFRERGIFYGFKRVVFYLLRPLTNLIKRSRFLVNLRYGVFPDLKQSLFFYQSKPRKIKLPKSELVKEVRKFWYSNIPGSFDLGREKISRQDIFIYGGPNPKFTCSICQRSEWLSRVRQKNLFIPHNCPQAKECQILCSYQGNELWTQFHQNFDFSINSDQNLPAPKCLYAYYKHLGHYEEHFFNPGCDIILLTLRRRLSYCCQVEPIENFNNVDWSDYDFLFITNTGYNPKFPRPNIPVILSAHDFWLENKNFQFMLNWLEPDILLTPYPTQWKESFKFSPRTRIVFYPSIDSFFFARPNLGDKRLDLLVIGAITNPIYSPRIFLNKQVSQLNKHYKIGFSNSAGASNVYQEGPVYRQDAITKAPICFLNKWSECLGSANYVIFGRVKDPTKQFLLIKYCEVLGSGAIPIFPEVPDLKLLGVKSFKHYIPLSEVEGNNKKLAYYLDHYENFRYIAENAVKWYKEKSDKMLFNDFEDMIREITGYKYPKRLV